MDYRIQTVNSADGVVENSSGAWLGEVTQVTPDGPAVVMPLADEDGEYIPAPANWRDLVIEQL